jgi:hypothetical protein
VPNAKPFARRALLEAGAAIGAALAAAALPSVAAEPTTPEADKIKQVDAKYQNRPNGQQRCEICLQFEAPNRCKIVQAPINPKGWCQFFAARENAR